MTLIFPHQEEDVVADPQPEVPPLRARGADSPNMLDYSVIMSDHSAIIFDYSAIIFDYSVIAMVLLPDHSVIVLLTDHSVTMYCHYTRITAFINGRRSLAGGSASEGGRPPSSTPPPPRTLLMYRLHVCTYSTSESARRGQSTHAHAHTR